jgi:TAP-like protein
MFWYSLGFYWPKGVPLAPRGNPFLKGIVSGQLYDSATPYEWTQEMRAAFKSTKLLTSQYYRHGLGSGDLDCQSHIQRYFETGEVGIVDGTVCGNCVKKYRFVVKKLDLFTHPRAPNLRDRLCRSTLLLPDGQCVSNHIASIKGPCQQIGNSVLV